MNNVEPETFLGQILRDGKWLDYARGTEAASRRWQEASPSDRRVVDWIYKERVLIPAPEVDAGRCKIAGTHQSASRHRRTECPVEQD